ncbi:methyltransferase domain-containing protein [Lentzea sp. NPDC060358]|uniref:methyltransferase domain-containing protein n=1 Tax=Lentzea sp. NPDC060358 TaxID=3347103 RepID=UPI0036585765
MSTSSDQTAELGHFSDVDSSAGAAKLVAFIEHAENMAPIPALRERSYDLLDVRPGDRVVDVGCGAGISVAELAKLGTEVTGVDTSEGMIDVARQRFPDCDYRVAGAEEIPLPDASADGYRAERVYQHLADSQVAITEARRVLKTGGRIVLIDIDADGWCVDSDDKELTRTLLQAFADTISNPWSGRKLRGLLLDNGFTGVRAEAFTCVYTRYDDCVHVLESIAKAGVTAGVASREQADGWLAEQRERAESDRTFVHGPLLVAAGVKTA